MCSSSTQCWHEIWTACNFMEIGSYLEYFIIYLKCTCRNSIRQMLYWLCRHFYRICNDIGPDWGEINRASVAGQEVTCWLANSVSEWGWRSACHTWSWDARNPWRLLISLRYFYFSVLNSLAHETVGNIPFILGGTVLRGDNGLWVWGRHPWWGV